MDSDGSQFNSRTGTVSIPDEYMPELATSTAVTSGILRTGQSFRLGTKVGKVCPQCSRIWQAWTLVCPKCNVETESEGVALRSPHHDTVRT